MERQNIFNFIHKTIRTMMYEAGQRLQTTDFTNAEETAKTADFLHEILGFLEEHAHHEDETIFPEFRQYAEEDIKMLNAEHDAMEAATAEIEAELSALRSLDDAEARVAAGKKIAVLYHKLTAYNFAHMNREEEKVLPVGWSHFTDDQLKMISGRVQQNIAPPRMAEWLKWMFKALNNTELTEMMKGIKMNAPAPVFENVSAMGKAVVGDVRWIKISASLDKALMN